MMVDLFARIQDAVDRRLTSVNDAHWITNEWKPISSELGAEERDLTQIQESLKALSEKEKQRLHGRLSHCKSDLCLTLVPKGLDEVDLTKLNEGDVRIIQDRFRTEGAKLAVTAA